MPAALEAILKIEVPVIVQIASRRMPVREVAALSPGSIIELPKLFDEDLDILASNRVIGTGAAVKVGENFGIRITSMGNLQERLDAIGGEAAIQSPPPPPTELDSPETDTPAREKPGADNTPAMDASQEAQAEAETAPEPGAAPAPPSRA